MRFDLWNSLWISSTTTDLCCLVCSSLVLGCWTHWLTTWSLFSSKASGEKRLHAKKQKRKMLDVVHGHFLFTVSLFFLVLFFLAFSEERLSVPYTLYSILTPDTCSNTLQNWLSKQSCCFLPFPFVFYFFLAFSYLFIPGHLLVKAQHFRACVEWRVQFMSDYGVYTRE